MNGRPSVTLPASATRWTWSNVTLSPGSAASRGTSRTAFGSACHCLPAMVTIAYIVESPCVAFRRGGRVGPARAGATAGPGDGPGKQVPAVPGKQNDGPFGPGRRTAVAQRSAQRSANHAVYTKDAPAGSTPRRGRPLFPVGRLFCAVSRATRRLAPGRVECRITNSLLTMDLMV